MLMAAVAAALSLASPAVGQQADLRSLLTRPIEIARTEPVTTVPLELRAGKLFIDAEVDGRRRQFIFDSGSPTILSRAFAETLGLRTIGRNTGVDANGAPVTMDVAIVERIAIGGVAFRNVPVFVFDFSDLPLGPCFIDGGVLGSEIFPGSAWRLDLESNLLTIAETAAALGELRPTVSARLHRFGYPHAPIVGYSLGGLSDRALFDTGSADEVTLFRSVFENPSVRESIVFGSIRTGRGSEGESAGGRGRTGDLFQFEISGLEVDGQALGTVRATTRGAPPSLLGAGLLASHIITLDYPDGRLLLEPRREPARRGSRPGYAIAYSGDHAEVVQLFNESPAMAAGLRLGDGVVEIDGRSLLVTPDNGRCESARWLVESFEAVRAAEIVVVRDGQRRTIHVPAAPPAGSERRSP